MPTPEYEKKLAEMQDVFVWESPAHEYFERGSRWYIVMGVVAIVLIVYAVWTNNFLFAFLVLLAAAILVMVGHKQPPTTLVQVGHHGVVWDGAMLPFDKIHHFAIVYKPPFVKVLYIQPASTLRPRWRIELAEQDPVALRNHLKQYAPEDLALQDEHISDTIARLLKL